MNIEWKNDNIRFVSFLDIMGFRNMVNINTHDYVKNKMQIISEVNKHIIDIVGKIKNEELNSEKYKNCDLKVIQFSDSIVLFTNEDTSNDFEFITFAVKTILVTAFKNSIPIKGAMSHGLMTADFNNSIFFGKPLIDAYLLQEEINYYGFILDNNAEKYWKNNFPSDKNFYKLAKTPLKKGNVNHLNLKLNKEVKTQEFESLYESVSGTVRIYVDNTIDMYKKIDK